MAVSTAISETCVKVMSVLSQKPSMDPSTPDLQARVSEGFSNKFGRTTIEVLEY